MEKFVQKTFKLMDYSQLHEEPFVLCHSDLLPRPGSDLALSSCRNEGKTCVIDKILLARATATAVSFSSSDYGCFTVPFTEGRGLMNPASISDFEAKSAAAERSPRYFTFKPFAMVRPFDDEMDMVIIFCRGRELSRLQSLLDELAFSMETPAMAFCAGSCFLVALPFLYLAQAQNKVLFCSVGKQDSASDSDSDEKVALLPTRIYSMIGDLLMNN